MTTCILGRAALKLYATCGLLLWTFELIFGLVTLSDLDELFFPWVTLIPRVLMICMAGIVLANAERISEILFGLGRVRISLRARDLVLVAVGVLGISLLMRGVAGLGEWFNPGLAKIDPLTSGWGTTLHEATRSGRIRSVATIVAAIVLLGTTIAQRDHEMIHLD
jgi:hypothetical protein